MTPDNWTEEQTARLRDYRAQGWGDRRCAAALGKTRHEVRHKRLRMERESLPVAQAISGTTLTFYDQACVALAAARETDQAKDIRDKAEALRHYARQAKNRELEVDAAEIRLRAERRIGELICDQKATLGLNKGSLRRGAETEPRDDRPTLDDAGIDKKLSARAQKLAAVPAKTFESRIAAWREEAQAANERVSLDLMREGDKAERRASRERELGAKQSAFPNKKYGVIYLDPPWRFEVRSRETGLDRSPDNHYPTMTIEEIAKLGVTDLAAPDCVMFLWVTAPILSDAIAVMTAWWKFTYKSHCVWVKDKLGTGYWFRNQHELLLVATRGNPPAPASGTRERSVIEAPRGLHSAKPEIFAEFIEGWYPTLPKIELFRRGPPRPGWDSWGNESESPPPAANDGTEPRAAQRTLAAAT